MSDRTERSRAREARRGLQSVVQLYLSRPPRRPIAWPEPEVESPPVESAPGEQVPARRAFEAEPHAAIDAPGFVPDTSGALRDAVGALQDASATALEPGLDDDAIARGIKERLDARIEAVSAIPFVDWDAEDAGAAAVEDAAGEDLELYEDVEPESFEAAPEAVLSGISLDIIEEPVSRGAGPGVYDAFAEIIPGAAPEPGDEAFAVADEDDAFSEDALPPQEIGSEALRAELAFKLEEHLEAGHDETEIFFEEDAHESAMTDVLPSTTTVEEIFDLVERSLSLGPASSVEAPASPRAADVVAWEILPDEVAEPEPETESETNAAAPPDEPAGAGSPDVVVEQPPALGERFAATDIAGEVLEPAADLRAPRVALFLSTLPPRLRRRLLDRLAAPLVIQGRHVLFLEPDPSDGDAGNVIEEALGLDSAAWRRSLGASPREILLMRPAQREQLFGALAAEERRSDLVLFGVGLPESIVCPRMLPLADTIVVGLTRQESSLYEAYRALRGLPERRPGFTPYALTIASSGEEAALLLERFRQIAKDFLRIPVLDGGWLELASMAHEPAGAGAAAAEGVRDPSRPGIAPELLALITAPREEASNTGLPGSGEGGHDGRPERAFFERLADWFSPSALRQ